MAQNLARAVTRLVSTSPFMTNISLVFDNILYLFARRPPRSGGKTAARGNDIYSPPKKRVTCVIFSSLPSSSGSLALAASNRAENGTKLTAVASSSRSHSHLRFRLDPLCTPLFVLLSCNDCSLLCFILQKRGLLLSLSLPLAFVAEMCYQPLTSPENLQKLRTSTL